MHIIYISDLHEEFDALPLLPSADALIIGGDFTNFGTPDKLREAIGIVESSHPEFLAVAGNLDPSCSDEILQKTGHLIPLTAPKTIFGLSLLGLGGSTIGPVATPNQWNDQEMDNKLQALNLPKTDILVTHAPPFDFGADKISSGLSVGSKATANLATRLAPKLHLCGHIHEAAGVFDENGIILVNPGPFGKNGNFADIQYSESDGFAVMLKQVK